MGNLIRLLPDHVANQIAAGEVVQRPGSVVKELLENAVDSGADEINVVIKDAGKTLIRIVDNGCGMNETDARMSLERHATSKILNADDLFAIKTMGFRGEALASIAAVSHMEVKTKTHDDELGTKISVEGSKVVSQEPCSTTAGTSISVKNLFYNIPARRKFLKSDAAEFRNILDEFQRVALPNFNLSFTLHHNGNELFHLPRSSFRQRVVGIFGKKVNQRLVPVDESTSIVKVHGFIGKPEAAKKTRGEQFFFVNKRYIKSGYFHTAVVKAFENLIGDGYHPSYFLHLDVDPKVIDVNIHPTKTEIKFEEEKEVFVILKTTLRKSLGQHNIVPSLDFSSNVQFGPPPKSRDDVEPPGVIVNTDFNPFKEQKKQQGKPTSKDWEAFFPKTEDAGQFNFESDLEKGETTVGSKINYEGTEQSAESRQFYQLHSKFILSHISSGMMIVHQQRAHERILFERYLQALEREKGFSQQQMFPVSVEFSTFDANLIKDLLEDLKLLGFDIEDRGKNTFVVNGLPGEASAKDPKTLLESMIDQYKVNRDKLTLDQRKNLAVSLARNTAIKSGRKLSQEEMARLIDELFGCEMPYNTPSGKNILTTLSLEDLNKKFE